MFIFGVYVLEIARVLEISRVELFLYGFVVLYNRRIAGTRSGDMVMIDRACIRKGGN